MALSVMEFQAEGFKMFRFLLKITIFKEKKLENSGYLGFQKQTLQFLNHKRVQFYYHQNISCQHDLFI